MSETIAKQVISCFLTAALLFPGTLFASEFSTRKSQQEIKKIISTVPANRGEIKKSDLVLLSVLGAAVAGVGGAYGGALWQRAKNNAAKEAVIKQLQEKVKFLNQAVKLEEAEQSRLLRILDEQTNLFSKVIKPNSSASLRELDKAELLGFNRGYDAAFRGSDRLSEVYYERGFREGYGQRGFEKLVDEKVITLPKSGKLSVKEAEALLKNLKDEIVRLQGNLGALKITSAEDREMVSLMSKVHAKFAALISSPKTEKTQIIEKELADAAKTLKALPVSGVKKELADSFSNYVLCRIKTRGWAVGIGALALVTASAVAASSDKPSAEISHNRSNVERALRDIYKTRPEFFATQILLLKEKYGTELVSSVLYENQEYLPILEVQLNTIYSKELGSVLAAFKGNSSPAQAKQALLESLS